MAGNQRWVLGNWKMNPATLQEVKDFCSQFGAALTTDKTANVKIGLAPVFIHLSLLQQRLLDEQLPVFVLAQNSSQFPDTGAHTGEISPVQLKSMAVNWSIVGHSERRADQYETDQCIAEKTKNALQAGLNVVVCVGETLTEREAGQAQTVVSRQLAAVLNQVAHIDQLPQRLLIAYEPIWAIGTGVAASSQDAQEMHAFIRAYLSTQNEQFTLIPLLYGGSVKPENSANLINQKDIDGFLVGGASLDPMSFVAIIQACQL